MTTFHVIKVNANCNILEIGLTYLLAVIIEAILKLTEPSIHIFFGLVSKYAQLPREDILAKNK
jgi:hypothetical protein